MCNIVSQVIGFVAFAISILAYHKNKKGKILGNMVISNILNLIHYLLLGAYTGSITKIIAIFRDSFIILKDKNNKYNKSIFLYIFIVVYITVAIITYKDIFSLLPLLAAIIYLIPTWNGSKKIVKRTAFICYFLWLAYNIFVFSLAGIVSNRVSLISTGIAVYNENKNK